MPVNRHRLSASAGGAAPAAQSRQPTRRTDLGGEAVPVGLGPQVRFADLEQFVGDEGVHGVLLGSGVIGGCYSAWTVNGAVTTVSSASRNCAQSR